MFQRYMFIYLDTEQTYQLGEKGLNDRLNRTGVSVALDEDVRRGHTCAMKYDDDTHGYHALEP